MAPWSQIHTAGLLPIGRFARLTGLSIGALRHYDELDLLRPIDVDRFHRVPALCRGPARDRPDDRAAPRPRGARSRRSGRCSARTTRRAAPAGLRPANAAPGAGRPPAPILHVLRQLSQGRNPIMTPPLPGTQRSGSIDERRTASSARPLQPPLDGCSRMRIGARPTSTRMVFGDPRVGVPLSRWRRDARQRCPRPMADRARLLDARPAQAAVLHATRCLELAEAALAAGVADDWDVPAALEGLSPRAAVRAMGSRGGDARPCPRVCCRHRRPRGPRTSSSRTSNHAVL